MSATVRVASPCLLALLITLRCGGAEYFNPLAPASVTGVIGDTVEIPCSLHQDVHHLITWIRVRDNTVLGRGRSIIVSDDRFNLRHYDYENTWYLSIDRSVKEDAGAYECRLAGDPAPTKTMNLRMIENSDTLRWRTDNRCGGHHRLSGALSNTPAECDPDGVYPCCSGANWCGFSTDHCNCDGCTDYRTIREEQQTDSAAASCQPPYQDLHGKCILYSSEGLPWGEADQYCKNQGGHLITFSTLDDLVHVVGNFARLKISKGPRTDFDKPFWVGLSTQGTQRADGQGLEWRWGAGDQVPDSSFKLSAVEGADERCGYLHSNSPATISHTDDCSALKLPVCEQPLSQ